MTNILNHQLVWCIPNLWFSNKLSFTKVPQWKMKCEWIWFWNWQRMKVMFQVIEPSSKLGSDINCHNIISSFHGINIIWFRQDWWLYWTVTFDFISYWCLGKSCRDTFMYRNRVVFQGQKSIDSGIGAHVKRYSITYCPSFRLPLTNLISIEPWFILHRKCRRIHAHHQRYWGFLIWQPSTLPCDPEYDQGT